MVVFLRWILGGRSNNDGGWTLRRIGYEYNLCLTQRWMPVESIMRTGYWSWGYEDVQYLYASSHIAGSSLWIRVHSCAQVCNRCGRRDEEGCEGINSDEVPKIKTNETYEKQSATRQWTMIFLKTLWWLIGMWGRRKGKFRSGVQAMKGLEGGWQFAVSWSHHLSSLPALYFARAHLSNSRAEQANFRMQQA